MKFWQFAKGVHPCLNTPQTTIITNQAKGSVEAICEILPLAKTSTDCTIIAIILQNLLKVARENTHACGCTIS